MKKRAVLQSGVPGVSWHKNVCKWRARKSGEHWGYYDSVEAAVASLLLPKREKYVQVNP